MSIILNQIFDMYPSELSLSQAQSILGGDRAETLALLACADLAGRQLDGEWVILKEHLLAFLLVRKSIPSGLPWRSLAGRVLDGGLPSNPVAAW